MTMQPVILLEFNELSPRLLDEWIDAGDLPNFKRLRDTSTVCVTEADELKPPNLEPWIQWYSLHTGLPFREHGVFRLTEGAKLAHPNIWDKLLEKGLRVMNFSSMNCRGFDQAGSIFLPDPWNNTQNASPSELAPFRAFLTKAVQEQSNARWTTSELFGAAGFMLQHGLTLSTVWAAARQIASEKLNNTPSSWKRVQILDRILLDVFVYLYKRQRPQFATFFSNSTAHLQHAYWRFFEPGKFSEPVKASDLVAYGDAVKFGYRSMDGLLGRVLALAERSGARVMFATALSQQAYTAYEGRGGRHYYRPHDVAVLLGRLGVRYQAIQPVMAHQYIATFDSAEACQEARRQIESPQLNGKQILDTAESDAPNKLIFGAQIYSPGASELDFELPAEGATVREPFAKYFYELDATKSGGHHPDGCFWFQSNQHKRLNSKVSILDVAPTILGHFGVSATSMKGRPIPAA